MHIQWRYLDIQTQSNTGLFDLELGRKTLKMKPRSPGATTLSVVTWVYSVRVMRRVPVDSLTLKFVRNTVYTAVCVARPNGSSTPYFWCEGCYALYPYGNKVVPCANCAIERESGIRIVLGNWKWERVWSV